MFSVAANKCSCEISSRWEEEEERAALCMLIQSDRDKVGYSLVTFTPTPVQEEGT